MIQAIQSALDAAPIHGSFLIAAIAVGFLLDTLLGDPLWLPHPVVGMGKAITWAERRLRARFGEEPKNLRLAGMVLAIGLPVATFALSWLAIIVAALIHPMAAFTIECIMCYQVLACRELQRQSMLVAHALKEQGLQAGRKMVGRIVGRDVNALDRVGVTKAAVETVAENANDGVITPLFYLFIGGGPLAMAYKAVSTLDSMVGYKNDRYIDFGRASAKLDDVLAFIPARICALCMIASCYYTGLDAQGAWRIWRRDHNKHSSPNAAHSEAATAGALGIQLAGDAVYFGKLVHKPTIGDATRPVEVGDIARANKLMLATSTTAFFLFGFVRFIVFAFA